MLLCTWSLVAGLQPADPAERCCLLVSTHTRCRAPAGPPCSVQGGDENIFAKAFESFDMLSRCLEEVSAPQQPEQAPPAALAAPPAAVATPAAPPAVSRPADEPPLISFD